MDNTIIKTNNGRCYKKPGYTATIAGIAAAGAAGYAVDFASIQADNHITNKISKAAQSANADEIRKGLQEALKKSGLNGKVKLNELNEKSITIFDFIAVKNKRLPKKLKKQMTVTEAIKNGKYATFNYETNEISINTKKLGAAGFHEIGHAINCNKSKFWKIIQKSGKPLKVLPALFIAVALLKRKKAEGEETKGLFDKVTIFIKNNAGKLSAAALLPSIAEELMATKRGNALAKQILTPENFKKVAKVNKWGAISYIAIAALTGGAAYLCNKVKDAVASPKEIKS